MQTIDGQMRLSASDLVGHLSCRHLTGLDLAVANGDLEKPKIWDPLLEILRERGAIHEQNYIDHLKGRGFDVVRIEGGGITKKQVEETLAAMRAGAQVVIQGALLDGKWEGRADILMRVDQPSALGNWSYEVIDTKLARETKAGAVLQLCLYSDLVQSVQGTLPEYMSIVSPWSDYEPQTYRTTDYSAYYRLVQRSLEASAAQDEVAQTYPDPKEHCDICRWRLGCDARRRDDDHLCLVAGISKLQIGELQRQGVNTTAALAGVPLPLPWKPERGSANSYERVREQARVQVEGREKGEPVHEILELEPGYGLACLPEPSQGDIFFDLEGDPFAGEGGLEYLFGTVMLSENGEEEYSGQWALSREQEKAAFEAFVDFVLARWQQHPDMHIYHFAPYEPGALKRLMGRYATREEEIDRMLRARLFVDLYGVVRRAIRASVESYSIKELEKFYGFTRSVALPEANQALAVVQANLELEDIEAINEESKQIVASYNRDDCASTRHLRDWLEGIRAALIADGAQIERPEPGEGDPSEAISDWQKLINGLVERLTADVPVDAVERNNEQQARWVLANILDWHRREEKSLWWEFFRLAELPAEDLFDERSGIAGLTFVDAVGGTARAPIHRYHFPAQETDLRGGEDLRNIGGAALGKLDDIVFENRTIDIKKRGDSAGLHPAAVFSHQVINTKVLADALIRIGEYVADHGLEGDGPYQAARDLLLRVPPRIGDQTVRQDGESALNAALRIAPALTGGVLPIQGPPGAGKTYAGARMICTLVREGKTVGITANSHKVIRNLLDEVIKAAEEDGVDLHCIQKVNDAEDNLPRLTFSKKNEDVLGAIGGACQVAAGTAWLWARPDAQDSVDVLFVDEAAQMSLANVLAISHAGSTIVLLGDPQQLEQPTQGSHPEGTGTSALDHILGEHQTIPWDRGLFLEETWRLHPDICTFTSEMFYEGRLGSRTGLEIQSVVTTGPIYGNGLRFLPVVHEGNQSSSPEEANKVFTLMRDLLAAKACWINKDGNEQPLTLDDILIIAPYNAQVFEIQTRLPAGARVGTVDKFQGQEAPVVIYSMATSSPSDAPHGMDFLYSLNRLNVASSRARCVCVLIASPSLFEPDCRTPQQMRLANAFCRYRELSIAVTDN